MKRFYSLILSITLALSLSFPVHAETDQLPLIKSGYTDEGIYYTARRLNLQCNPTADHQPGTFPDASM